MQPYTGELRAMDDAMDLERAKHEGFEEIPENLNRAARRKLNGKKMAMVSLNSGGKLSKHAAARRKQLNKAAASRKKNR